MLSRRLRTGAVLAGLAFMLWAGPRAPAQDPGDVPLNQPVVDENDPNGPVATTMRELWAYHDWLVRQPPRVRLDPAIPVSNGLWPMGWTGGVDDPSGGAIAQDLRHTWSNQDTLAYTQWAYREHRRECDERRARRLARLRAIVTPVPPGAPPAANAPPVPPAATCQNVR